MPEIAFNDDLDDDQGNNPVREQREAIKRYKAELADAKKQLEELSAFKAEAEKTQRQTAVESAFAQFGQTPTAAKYFPGDMEPTKENVAVYLKDFGIDILSEDEQEAQEQTSSDFAPVTLGGASGRKRLSHEEYQKLLNENPAEALKAVGENRVEGMLAPR